MPLTISSTGFSQLLGLVTSTLVEGQFLYFSKRLFSFISLPFCAYQAISSPKLVLFNSVATSFDQSVLFTVFKNSVAFQLSTKFVESLYSLALLLIDSELFQPGIK
jgi:hypothetical protein